MLQEKNENLKITELLLNNGVRPEDIPVVFPVIAYDVLKEKAVMLKEEPMVNGSLTFDKDFEELLNRIDYKTARNIKKGLKSFTSKALCDYALYAVSNAPEIGVKLTDSSSVPLNQLAISFLNLQAGDMVFDLGSGKGSFLVNAYRYAKEHKIIFKDIFGLEINKSDAAICRANLLIEGSDISYVINEDFIDYKIPPFNKGFVFPPIRMRMPDYKTINSQVFDYAFTNRNSYEWVFVDRLLRGIVNSQGRGVAVLTPHCMFNEADKEYRDHLIKEGMIEAIIELPMGSFNFCATKPVVVVFSKGNKGAKIVDATSLNNKNVGKFAKFDFDYKKVLKLVNEAKVIDNDELLKAHSLSASSLLAAQGETFTGTPLKELAEVFTGSQYTAKNFEEMFKDVPTGYRILTSSDINDGVVEWNKLQSIDYKDGKFDKYALKENDVVVTAKSSKVKVAVVDIKPKEKILVTGGMIIVRPNTEKLNPTYLKIFLDSEKGQMALKAIQRGSIIISINAKDLANVLIPDASIEKQNIVSKEYNNKLSTYLALKEELAKIENQLHSFDLDDVEED